MSFPSVFNLNGINLSAGGGAGRFLWYSTILKRQNIFDLLISPVLICMLEAMIEDKEDPDKHCEQEKDGVSGGINKKKPYFLQMLFYYFLTLVSPPSVTVYVLFDRIFYLVSLSIS